MQMICNYKFDLFVSHLFLPCCSFPTHKNWSDRDFTVRLAMWRQQVVQGRLAAKRRRVDCVWGIWILFIHSWLGKQSKLFTLRTTLFGLPSARPWFCKMAFLLSCDVGIYFDLTEPDVPAFEESYEAASTDIKKNMRFKIWNAPTVVLSSKLLFCDFLCSLTMKIRSFDARFQCRMKHIHTRVRSAIENIDSANETSTVEPPSVALL